MRLILLVLLMAIALPAGAEVLAPAPTAQTAGDWAFREGDWRPAEGVLVRSTPANPWREIKRAPVKISAGEWHKVECAGPRIAVRFNGAPVLSVQGGARAAGRVGVGTSQGQVAFRALQVDGEVQKGAEALKDETPPYKVISRGPAAGTYQAFPDACRLKDGSILCVFYGGYGHISLPTADWPKGGRVCMVRSRDEGRTWSAPEVLFDDADDNRDPHIAQTSDGTLWCSFFSYRKKGDKVEYDTNVVCSRDGGETWETKARTLAPGWAESAPVRELPDGTYLLGVYTEDGASWYGGVLRSTDRGKSWSAPVPIGKDAGLPLDAETDVIRLKDGTLYAALRSSKINMHYATSADEGLTWSAVKDIGFKAHCPHFTRLSTGEILLCHRLPATSLHVSRDDAKTWQGPYQVDTVGGAYPSTVELKDGSVLIVYYEEGQGSAIRAQRFRLTPEGIEPVLW